MNASNHQMGLSPHLLSPAATRRGFGISLSSRSYQSLKFLLFYGFLAYILYRNQFAKRYLFALGGKRRDVKDESQSL